MSIIDIENLTIKYGHDKGLFNVDLKVNEGEAVGIIGLNNSGKSLILRALMGLVKANAGSCAIDGYDSFEEANRVSGRISYIPDHVVYPYDMRGIDIIRLGVKLCNRTDGWKEKAINLSQQLDFNYNERFKVMSAASKQKLAIICCFLKDGDIFLLDNPTKNLDTLCRKRVISLIREKQKQNKTILMTSSFVEDIELVCQKAVIINKGSIVDIQNIANIKKMRTHTYLVDFGSKDDMALFSNEIYNFELVDDMTLRIKNIENTKEFLNTLSNYNIINLETERLSLEEFFLSIEDIIND